MKLYSEDLYKHKPMLSHSMNSKGENKNKENEVVAINSWTH